MESPTQSDLDAQDSAITFAGHGIETPVVRDSRWRSFFRFNAILRRHTERPAYL